MITEYKTTNVIVKDPMTNISMHTNVSPESNGTFVSVFNHVTRVVETIISIGKYFFSNGYYVFPMMSLIYRQLKLIFLLMGPIHHKKISH